MMKKKTSKKTGKKSIKNLGIGALAVLAIGAAASSGDTEDTAPIETEPVQVEEQVIIEAEPEILPAEVVETPTPTLEPESASEPEPTPAPAPAPTPTPAPAPEPAPEPAPAPAPELDPEQAFREMLKQYNYVGSIDSDKYHYPTCRWTNKINDTNLVHFDTEEEAAAHGYVPCGTCNP